MAKVKEKLKRFGENLYEDIHEHDREIAVSSFLGGFVGTTGAVVYACIDGNKKRKKEKKKYY